MSSYDSKVEKGRAFLSEGDKANDSAASWEVETKLHRYGGACTYAGLSIRADDNNVYFDLSAGTPAEFKNNIQTLFNLRDVIDDMIEAMFNSRVARSDMLLKKRAERNTTK